MHYRPLFRCQDLGFIGYQAQVGDGTADDQLLIEMVCEGITQLQKQHSDGRLLIPVTAAQICNEDLMTMLLDKLLKQRFSWRDLVLVLHQLPQCSQCESFNQSVYRLRSCQLALWLNAPLLDELHQLESPLLFDAIYFDYASYPRYHSAASMNRLEQFCALGIGLVVSESPSSPSDWPASVQPCLSLTVREPRSTALSHVETTH